MKITELFNAPSVSAITVETFLDFKKNGNIPAQAMVDFLGTRDDQDSSDYFKEISVTEYAASLIAEQYSRRSGLLNEARTQYYNARLNDMLSEEESIIAPQTQLAPIGN